jgi:hypothetical protein
VNRRQRCLDGDPACDADRTVDGVCTYRLGVCLNHADPALSDCPAGGDPVVAYELTQPTPTTRKPTDAANGTSLADALLTLGGERGGTRQNVVTFTSPIEAATCSALTTVQVPVKGRRPGGKILRGKALLGSGVSDDDRLRLECKPVKRPRCRSRGRKSPKNCVERATPRARE